jgi:predicted AlkP superfamily phosphohydrolase/phosphomutase
MGMTKDIISEPITEHWTGVHEAPYDPEYIGGVIIMSGQGIKRNHRITGARNIDFAPTVLSLLGENKLSEMDGEALVQALD